jgi:hypothetical protein
LVTKKYRAGKPTILSLPVAIKPLLEKKESIELNKIRDSRN